MKPTIPMHNRTQFAGLELESDLLFAPMAGVTHSALRRLVAGFGGCGALYTEMLSARALRHEDLLRSPFTKRRAEEGVVVYQLLTSDADDTAAAIERLGALDPAAIDINLGCPAPEVRKHGGGCNLFMDLPRLESVLVAARKTWNGPLTVKCRLGEDKPDWRAQLLLRLRLFENTGMDALTVHPRFHGEKLKRTARWNVFDWLVDETSLPLVGNGDILTSADIDALRKNHPSLVGFMVGRAAVCQPWFFAAATGTTQEIDYFDTWHRLYEYVLEDFPPEKRLGRIKEFTAYYARNFMFGHELFRASQGSRTLEQLRERAEAFLTGDPQRVKAPSMSGI